MLYFFKHSLFKHKCTKYSIYKHQVCNLQAENLQAEYIHNQKIKYVIYNQENLQRKKHCGQRIKWKA